MSFAHAPDHRGGGIPDGKQFKAIQTGGPSGSIRDDLVIEECDRKGMVMAFTGMRLFHH